MTLDESMSMSDQQKFLPESEAAKQDSVRFENGKNESIEFAGLSKEQMAKYSNDPTWVRVRWVLFALFWIVWLSLLAAAVAIVVMSPRCAVRPKHHWWQKEVVYQVDVAKFKDSNGDLTGDLQGITSTL